MSSSSTSASKNLFSENQGQLFDQQNGILTPRMNTTRHSPSPSSTTRLIAPRPFYRSQVTPDPFDYSNNSRREADQQRHGQNRSERRNSVHQINALISFSAKQSPLITIASGGSPARSEIRLLSSPNTNKSTLREIRISRPVSPSISINLSGTNQPITFASDANSGPITDRAFRISVGTPTKLATRGQTSPSFHPMEMHRDSADNRYTSNIVANHFKPSVAFINSKSNIYDRLRTTVNLPPAPNSTSLTLRHGHAVKKESSQMDHLTKLLMKSMNSSNEPNFFGMCGRCKDEIVGEENGLVAMDHMYHVACFTCTMCGCRLRGMHFYSMENKPYCESCYINSLEKCVVCSQPITDRILRATGKPYHAQCFSCIACQKSLDGITFTADATMQIHCMDCFHQKFAPRCYACHRAILPSNGEQETVRIVTLDRSYHLDCYRCENCKISFTSEEGCYPIDDHVFCLQCNRIYTGAELVEH